MKRIILHATTLFFAVLVLSGTILHSPRSFAAGMTDYCQVPPYVVQNIAPNVMLMVDSSGSMFNFSYYDGFNTPTNLGDDDLCTNSGSPCTGFTDPGTYPGYKYYGYFDSDYWYTYSSNRFVPSAPKTGSGLSGARDKLSTEWDGNFLNWLTMRRVDILRKVMTGKPPPAREPASTGSSERQRTATTAGSSSGSAMRRTSPPIRGPGSSMSFPRADPATGAGRELPRFR